jgi:hypothetical protein
MMDIEVLMDGIETIAKAEIPALITAMNTEKGDALLDAFNPSAFYKYKLPGVGLMPNYPVCFLFYITSSDVLDSQRSVAEVSHEIALDVIVKISADSTDKDERRLLRLHRIIKKLFTEKISLSYDEMKLKSVDLQFGSDANKNQFGIAQIVFTAEI